MPLKRSFSWKKSWACIELKGKCVSIWEVRLPSLKPTYYSCFIPSLLDRIPIAYTRSDIADRLHKVIETQWQKTLEIIASDASNDPNQPALTNKCNQRKNNNELNNGAEQDNRRNSYSKCDNVNIHTPLANKKDKYLNKSLDWRSERWICKSGIYNVNR